jgi:hypothetical protein
LAKVRVLDGEQSPYAVVFSTGDIENSAMASALKIILHIKISNLLEKFRIQKGHNLNWRFFSGGPARGQR